MKMKPGLVIFVVAVLFSSASLKPIDASQNFEELFRAGEKAYQGDNWKECISNMEKSVKAYHHYEEELFKCFRKCNSQEKTLKPMLTDVPKLIGIHKNIVACVNKCKEEKNLHNITSDGVEIFRSQEAYSYLNRAYYMRNETNDLIKSARSAFTYLAHNPKSERMKENLNYLVDGLHVPRSKISTDLEMPKFQEHYELGETEYWVNYNAEETIKHIEKSLREFYNELELCKIRCIEDSHRGVDLDDVKKIANSYAKSLSCRLDCHEVLESTYRISTSENCFLSHYNYLQINYLEGNQKNRSLECVLSYALFHPTSTVVENLFFLGEYAKDIGGKHFTPRKEALNYYQEFVKEKTILKNLIKHLGDIDNKIKMPKEYNQEIETIITQYMQKPHLFYEEKGEKMGDEVKITLEEDKLKGANRIVADGLATEKECRELTNLVVYFGETGEKYWETRKRIGSATPGKNNYEDSRGITLGRTAFDVYLGNLSAESVHLLQDISEKSRNLIKSHFKLKQPLYHTFTHLVCHTSLKDVKEKPEQKNFIYSENEEWKSWSAKLYLNGDFEDGDFVFADSKNAIQAKVKPECGRLVAFKANDFHGELPLAVNKGSMRRCQIDMWFTDDENSDSREQLISRLFLLVKKEKKDDSPAKDEL